MKGFDRTLERKDSQRYSWLLRKTSSAKEIPPGEVSSAYAVDVEMDREEPRALDGSAKILPEGISFDIPPGVATYPREMLQALRRIQVNTGHPINSDMRRWLRLAAPSRRSLQATKYRGYRG